jgi:hypothetical protein
VRITSSTARFSSLKTCDSDRMEVNQILGSEALGLSSPLEIARTRSRMFSWGAMPILMTFMLFSPLARSVQSSSSGAILLLCERYLGYLYLQSHYVD